jgi:hypothetical protein
MTQEGLIEKRQNNSKTQVVSTAPIFPHCLSEHIKAIGHCRAKYFFVILFRLFL